MRFSNLDVKSRLHNYLRKYEFRTLNTCVNTCKYRQIQKKKKKMGKEPRKECKVRKVKKKKKGNQY